MSARLPLPHRRRKLAYSDGTEVDPEAPDPSVIDPVALDRPVVDPPVLDPATLYPAGLADPATFEPNADESWLTPDTRRRVKVALPTFLLVLLVVVAGAFWGGAEVFRHFGSNNAGTGNLAALGRSFVADRGSTGNGGTGPGTDAGGTGATASGRDGFGGFGGAAGFGGAGGFETPTASGTVAAVAGDQLVVKSSSGTKVTVKLTPSTVVTRVAQGSAGAIKVGDTVRVEGTKAKDGTVTASTVTATAAGVSAGGGFGGFGGTGSRTTTGGSNTGAGGAGAGGSTSPTTAGSDTGAGAGAGGSTSPTTVPNGGFSGDGSGVSGL